MENVAFQNLSTYLHLTFYAFKVSAITLDLWNILFTSVPLILRQIPQPVIPAVFSFSAICFLSTFGPR